MPTANYNASRIIAERKRRALVAQAAQRSAAADAGTPVQQVPNSFVLIEEKLGAKYCNCAEGTNMRSNPSGCGCA